MSIDSAHFSSISLRLLVVLGLALSSGCAMSEFLPGNASANTAQPEPVAAPGSDWTICKDPRPRICTMEYDPVCVITTSGLRRTYPSPCNACADVAVEGHKPNACEAI